MAPRPSVGACTVVTRSHLADARLAARSILEHHPDTHVTVLVVDGDHSPPATWTRPGVELVTPSQLGLDDDELLTMAAIYDPAELACALKPLALRRVLERADVAIYVDGDLEVLAPMPELFEAAADSDVVLVPHVLSPVPRDGRQPDERVLLGAGVFNGGLLACRRQSGDFLDWWDERLRRDCLNQPELMLHGDQRWLDFVPTLFDHHIWRDPTYDVAYWNLHERPTAWVDGRLCVVDRPVRCFHYSGLTDARPWVLSGFASERPRAALADLPGVARQCRGWLARRRSVDAEGDRALGYPWATSAGGITLDRRGRRLWRDALLAAEADPSGATGQPPSPFAGDGKEWERWIAHDVERGQAGWYLQRVWAETRQLQLLFPDVPGSDEVGLLRWAAGAEADQSHIHPAFRPLPTELDVHRADPPARLRRPPRPDARAQQPIESIDRARTALDGPDHRVPDRSSDGLSDDEVAAALTDAVAELARRLADLSDRVDRTNDAVHVQDGRVDELVALDDQRRAEAEELVRRVREGEASAVARREEVEAALAARRDEVEGAVEMGRITAAVVADAELRLRAEVVDLAGRLDKASDDAPVGGDDHHDTSDRLAASQQEDQP